MKEDSNLLRYFYFFDFQEQNLLDNSDWVWCIDVLWKQIICKNNKDSKEIWWSRTVAKYSNSFSCFPIINCYIYIFLTYNILIINFTEHLIFNLKYILYIIRNN